MGEELNGVEERCSCNVHIELFFEGKAMVEVRWNVVDRRYVRFVHRERREALKVSYEMK